MTTSNPTIEIKSKTPVAFAGEAAGNERFFKIEQWKVEVGGQPSDRLIWRRGDFVLIVAFTTDAQIVLIREYKQAAEQVLLGIPAGAIKKDEAPERAAVRELEQETGYTITGQSTHQTFGPFFNSPDKSTERHFVVVLRGVVKEGNPAPEDDETILGTQLTPLDAAKPKLVIGLHRMAVDIAINGV